MGDAERTVRTVDTDEELTTYLRGIMTAFLTKRVVLPEQIAHARARWDLARTWAAFDGDVQCGSTRTFPTTLRLPGAAAAAVSCLTQVTVLPTHTRRGHLTRLMRTQLEAAIDDGMIASLLVAAEWPIYGRFGYGPTTEWAEWNVDLPHAEVIGPPTGHCEIVDVERFDATAAVVLDRHHAACPGSIGRPDWFRSGVTGLDPRPGEDPDPTRVWVVHFDDAGEPDAFVMYGAKEHWVGMRPAGTIKVDDLVAVDGIAERELWRYLLEVDLATTVEWRGDPNSVVRSVLVDGRAARQVGRWDHTWARLLDVPAALTARSYASAGAVVLEVLDPFLGRGGRFHLDASPSGASCESTTAAPELTLPISALGAAWLGGTDLRTVAAAGTLEEHTPGALERLAALLRWHQAPWCPTDF